MPLSSLAVHQVAARCNRRRLRRSHALENACCSQPLRGVIKRPHTYNKTVRYDWLAHYLFETVADVQEYATKWLWSYNHERPNTAIGGVPPKQKLLIAP
ncbi:hypothetical protein CEJ98_37440 (plasmid) [Burkholderia gladioli pv. gladioli]|nr:hypothetical protein CEJ98_37440 [Burkholderia gladioli pv. gladioli]AWY49892.1 hypothetical protein A8H28_00785 [Burkholderia gladioli pv. gladioli]